MANYAAVPLPVISPPPLIHPFPAAGVIVTVNEPDASFPAASAAVHPTVVTPTGNVLPDAGAHASDVTPTRSAAVAANVTTAPAAPVAGCVMAAGSVST